MICETLMPTIHTAVYDLKVFGLQNLDEKTIQETYNELLAAQIVIYNELIKPYADQLDALEQKKSAPLLRFA